MSTAPTASKPGLTVHHSVTNPTEPTHLGAKVDPAPPEETVAQARSKTTRFQRLNLTRYRTAHTSKPEQDADGPAQNTEEGMTVCPYLDTENAGHVLKKLDKTSRRVGTILVRNDGDTSRGSVAKTFDPHDLIHILDSQGDPMGSISKNLKAVSRAANYISSGGQTADSRYRCYVAFNTIIKIYSSLSVESQAVSDLLEGSHLALAQIYSAGIGKGTESPAVDINNDASMGELVLAVQCNPQSVQSNYALGKSTLIYYLHCIAASNKDDDPLAAANQQQEKQLATELRTAASHFFNTANARQKEIHNQEETGSAFFLAYINLLDQYPNDSSQVEKGLLQYVKKDPKTGYFLAKLYDWRAFQNLDEASSIGKSANIGKKTLLHLEKNPHLYKDFTPFRRQKLAGGIGVNLFKQGARKYGEAMIYLLSSVPSGLVSAYKAIVNIRLHSFAQSKSKKAAVMTETESILLWKHLDQHLESFQVTTNLGLYKEIAEFQDEIAKLKMATAAYKSSLETAGGAGDRVTHVMDEYIPALEGFLQNVGGQLLLQNQVKKKGKETLRDCVANQETALAAIISAGGDIWTNPQIPSSKQQLAASKLRDAMDVVNCHLTKIYESANNYMDELDAGKGKKNKAHGRLKPSDLKFFCELHVNACVDALQELPRDPKIVEGLPALASQDFVAALKDQIDQAWLAATETSDHGGGVSTTATQTVSGKKSHTATHLRASDGENASKELPSLQNAWEHDPAAVKVDGWDIPALKFGENSEVSTKTTVLKYIHTTIMRNTHSHEPDFSKNLFKKLEAQYSSSFHKVLEENQELWDTVKNPVSVNLQGKQYDFKSITTPAGVFLDPSLPEEKRITRGDKRGVGAHNRKQVDHVNNLWKTELHNSEDKVLFSAFRHGVLSSFNLTKKKIFASSRAELHSVIITDEVTDNYNKIATKRASYVQDLTRSEILQKLLSYRAFPTTMGEAYNHFMEDLVSAASKTAKDNMKNELLVTAWKNSNGPDHAGAEPMPLNILSIDLLTPEDLKKTLHVASKDKATPREMVEAQEDLFREIRDENKGKGSCEIQTEACNVSVSPNILSCCYGVNDLAVGATTGASGLQAFVPIHAQSINDPISQSISSMAKIIPSGKDSNEWKTAASDDNKSLDGIALRKIRLLQESTDVADKKKADLMVALIGQINHINENKLYQKLDNDGYKMVTRLAYLGYLLDCTVFFNCKSGKDRTAFMDAEVKAFAARVAITGKLPEVGEKLEDADMKTLVGDFHLKSGGLEVQRSCVGVPGGKVSKAIALPRMTLKQYALYSAGSKHVKS